MQHFSGKRSSGDFTVISSNLREAIREHAQLVEKMHGLHFKRLIKILPLV